LFDEKARKLMKKSLLPIVIAAGAFLGASAQADEIQFTTLPQPVQTTVVRETHISGPAGVVQVIHEANGIYAVTVQGDAGRQVVYVNDSGAIVQAPSTTTVQTAQPVQATTDSQQTTTTTTTVQRAQPAQPATDTHQTVVTYDEVQNNHPRYELLEKKGKKEIYLDHQTGQKVTVKREDN
jgi:cell division septation protein DedD